jgi:hypothetical protein
MVKAEITVGTCYGDMVIPVEVLGKGPRPGMAWVRALNGLRPFTKTSHGGPYQDSTSILQIPLLREIHIEKDVNDDRDKGLTQETIIEIQPLVSDQRMSKTNQGILSEDRNLTVEKWLLEGTNMELPQRTGGLQV